MKMDVVRRMLGGGAFGCGFLAYAIFQGTAFPDVDVLWAIPLAIIAAILGGLYFLHFLRVGKLAGQQSKKLEDFAEQMGMKFSEKGDSALRESLSLFDMFSRSGVNITNVLSGDSEQLGYGEEFKVRILECSYVVASGEHGTKTIVQTQTVIYFRSPQLNLPKFQLSPEEWHHKIGSKLGYQDIDFESHPTAVEFSKKYLLRGKDEQTIRALFTDAVLTFFAAHPDKVCVEGSDDQLIWYQPGKIIEPEDIPAFMKEGFEVFRLFARKQN